MAILAQQTVTTKQMATLESAEFSASEEYLTIFHRYITRSIEALHNRIAPDLEKLQALSAESREQAWHLLDYGLKLSHGWEVVGKLLLALAPHMERAGFRHDWLPYLERGVICSRHAEDAASEAQLSLYIGRLHRLRGEWAAAREWLATSAALCQQRNDPRGRALALNQLAYVARLQSDYDEAKEYVQEALALLSSDDTERATSYWVLGSVAQHQMKWAEAEEHQRAALQIWQDVGDQQRVAWILQNLGEAFRGAGRYDEAADHMRQAIALLGELHDPVNQAIARMSLGVVHLYQDKAEPALALFTLAEPVFRQVGDHLHLAMVYTNIAIAERELGQWQAAEQAGKKAIQLWEMLGDLRYLANALDELGASYLAQARHAEAIAAFEKGLAVLAQVPPDPFHDMVQNSLHTHLQEAKQWGCA